jgi:predicted amidohydrolase YtcJ
MAARLTAYIVASIVAITFIAGLLVGAQRDIDGPVDLVILNGRVFTGTAGEDQAEAVAVQGNKILRVGSNREIQRLARAQTLVLDAHGGSVLPGFNDGHVHALRGGLGLGQVDLVGAQTVEQISTAIRSWARTNRERPWVTGRGWDDQLFTPGLPTRQLLDQMVPDRPAVLTARDRQSVWANTAALKIAGITRRTPNPANGTVLKDARSGEPTGVLEEAAIDLVMKYVPEPSRDEQLFAIRQAIGEAHRYGVTSLHNISGTPEELELYEELGREGHLLVRVYAILSPSGTTRADLDRLEAVRQRFPDDPLLKAGGISLVVDGPVGSRTVAALGPSASNNAPRDPSLEQATLDRLVAELDRRGWQLMIDAVGETGTRMALDALEHAARVNPAPERGRRHRVEQLETVEPADFPRFGRLGVIASIQPHHDEVGPSRVGFRASNLGDEGGARIAMYHSIASEGGRLVFGSDWPLVSLDPRLGLQVAVNGSQGDALPEVRGTPAIGLALDRALAAYTSEGAWASFDEQRKGRLAPDMLADIVVLSRDIFALPAERLAEAEVAFTIFDGKVVYERQVDTTEQ